MTEKLPRKESLRVAEGICPICRKPMQKFLAVYIHCGTMFTTVDPRDDIRELLGENDD